MEIARLNAWYQRELKALGVKVELNHEPCVNCIRKEAPDAIILATGSVVSAPAIPGLDRAVTSLEAIDYPEKIGRKVVIVGGGLVGCEIALDEANHGKDVTVVEALDDIMAAGGTGAPYPNKQMICDLFAARGVKVYTGTKLVEVTAEGACVEKADGTKALFPADTVISALGFRPTPNLKEDWKALHVPICEVGDANGAATIMKAIWEAYEAANSI